MSLRHLTSVNDLSNDEIMRVLETAKQYEAALERRESLQHLLPNRILAALFFEPSTRTRLSFETAMLRAGGRVIHHESPNSSSMTKGESLSDAVQVISRYADVIVMRHPLEGSARLAAESSRVPVLNGGDGAHEHPTQTLCDLFVIYKKWGKFKDVRVLLRGDLLHGRTVHSLAIALGRLGADLIVSSPEGFGLPEYVTETLNRVCHKQLYHVRGSGDEALLNGYPFDVDAIYVSPSEMGILVPDALQIIRRVLLDPCNATYVTRLQRERLEATSQQNVDLGVVNKKRMSDDRFGSSIIMHPLPRIDELSTDLDTDDRSKYFEQAAGGVPVRMALLEWLLSEGCGESPPEAETFVASKGEIACENPKCITHPQHKERGVLNKFVVMRTDGVGSLQCRYCGHRADPTKSRGIVERLDSTQSVDTAP